MDTTFCVLLCSACVALRKAFLKLQIERYLKLFLNSKEPHPKGMVHSPPFPWGGIGGSFLAEDTAPPYCMFVHSSPGQAHKAFWTN
jgi:hypothetical protein